MKKGDLKNYFLASVGADKEGKTKIMTEENELHTTITKGETFTDIFVSRDGEMIATLRISLSNDTIGEVVKADIDFAEYVYVNGKHWLDAEVADRK